MSRRRRSCGGTAVLGNRTDESDRRRDDETHDPLAELMRSEKHGYPVLSADETHMPMSEGGPSVSSTDDSDTCA